MRPGSTCGSMGGDVPDWPSRTRNARRIASTDPSTLEAARPASFAASPARDNQVKPIRPALDRHDVIAVGGNVALWPTQRIAGHVGVEGARWPVARAADIPIAARGRGEPSVAWIVPILDRARQVIAGACHAGMVVRAVGAARLTRRGVGSSCPPCGATGGTAGPRNTAARAAGRMRDPFPSAPRCVRPPRPGIHPWRGRACVKIRSNRYG